MGSYKGHTKASKPSGEEELLLTNTEEELEEKDEYEDDMVFGELEEELLISVLDTICAPPKLSSLL